MMEKTKVPTDERLAFQINEAAAIAGVSRSTIYKAAKLGKIKITKVLDRSVVTRSELNRLLAGPE
jgi:predicted DNA-binding protein (UPF0251 family)